MQRLKGKKENFCYWSKFAMFVTMKIEIECVEYSVGMKDCEVCERKKKNK